MTELPFGYLKWLLTADNAEAWLKEAIRHELARRGERFLPAAAVLADLEEELTARVADDPGLSDWMSATFCDHVLEAFEDVRRRHGIGSETELHVPAQRERVFAERRA